jgi:uncharacterized protein YvpB
MKSLLQILLLGIAWGAQAASVPPTRLVWWTDPTRFTSTSDEQGPFQMSPRIHPGFIWKEVVLSWNVPETLPLSIEVRAVHGDEPGPWLAMGRWSADTNQAPRTSIRGQKNTMARIETDTLLVAQPAEAIEVRIRFPSDSTPPNPFRFGISFLGAESTESEPSHFPSAWGRLLDVPVRSQADYPEGIHSWCSPTSLSMILAWWGQRLDRADLIQDVRQVAKGVHDPGWPGTGNWSFNVAYAGQHPGIAACVARLGGVGDLERWINSGIPVAASVSYAQLKGSPTPRPGDGHLVVVTGFTRAGDVRVHDPGVRKERVIRVIPRADFERAWNHSSRTAYLVWPEGHPLPPDSAGRWPSP